jgi:hypothetical protein
MSILSFDVSWPGVEGVDPRLVRIVSTDNYATITAAGYLNGIINQGFSLKSTDIVWIIYNFTNNVSTANWLQGMLSFSNGIVTVAPVLGALVSPPLTVGDIPSFANANGGLQDSGISAALLQVYTQSITLTQSQVQGAYATPVQLLPAPGAGKAYIVIEAIVYTNFQTSAFAGGGNAYVQYSNTVHGGGTDALSGDIPSAEITASSSQLYALGGNVGNALTGITNEGIFFSNASGPFTGGSSASTIVITLNYQIVNATV